MDPDLGYTELRRASYSVWVPWVVFAHVWALFWLLRVLANVSPDLWRRCTTALKVRRPRPRMPRPKSAELWKEHHRVGPTLLLEWEGLGCAYNTPAGIKTVLKDVSGLARPFEMLALLGPSGAGKSTLLDILAGRKSVGRLTGSVSVNGVPRGSSFARYVSYVPQEDTFLPTMTVAETCRLHAALTLPRGTPRRQMAQRIDEVLAAMGMLHASDTLVGGVLPGGLSLRGLSGGERKRVSVAVGILAAPSIIFLDEPTSGLDSCSALSVVEHLRERARDSGLTIVASIHQPRAAVWACFDTCAVLSGGMLLYTGRCGGVVPWFESIGLGPWESAVHGTACDWVMDLVNIGFATKPQAGGGRSITSQEELEEAAARFASHYAATASQLKAEAGAAAAAAAAGGGTDEVIGPAAEDAGAIAVLEDTSTAQSDQSKPAKGAAGKAAARGKRRGGGGGGGGAARDAAVAEKRRRPSWWTTFSALLWREFLGSVRNPADVVGRMLLFCYMGVGCGLVFWRMGDANNLESIHNRVNVLFILSIQLLLLPYVYLSLYAADKRHYTADISARLYTPSPYYAAKSLATLPFMILNVLACVYTAYGMTGMQLTAQSMAVHGASSVLLYLVAQQVHSVSSIVMPNEDATFLITIVWSAYCMYFSNFVIRFDDMNQKWLPPLRWFSALYYSYAAYLKAEFGHATFSCADGLLRRDLIGLFQSLLPKTQLARGVAAFGKPGPDCAVNMGALLDYYGVTSPAWVYLLALVAYLAVVHVLTFLGLLLLARKERR